MLNLLIMDNDINHSISLLNYISMHSNQFRVHSIATDLSEGIKILNTGAIDLTLINLDCKINTIINNLHTISKTYFEKYRKSVLIFSNDSNAISSDSYVYECAHHSISMSKILQKANEMAKNKVSKLNNSILSHKINTELEYIGYNLSYNGTKYLSECIALIYNNNDYGDNLNKNVYPIIAKRHHKTANNIKCNITKATNSMFYECDETRLKDYFNFYTIAKPKPKVVIHTLLNKINGF